MNITCSKCGKKLSVAKPGEYKCSSCDGLIKVLPAAEPQVVQFGGTDDPNLSQVVSKKLKPCSSCNAWIAKNAASCPRCGGKNFNPKGCLIYIMILLLLLATMLVAVSVIVVKVRNSIEMFKKDNPASAEALGNLQKQLKEPDKLIEGLNKILPSAAADGRDGQLPPDNLPDID